MPQPPASAKATPAKASSVFAILGLVAALVVFVFWMVSSSVEGEIRASGKPFGTYIQKPTECYSGEHQNFFGAWVAPELESKDGRTGFKGGIKIVKNHLDEWTVYVESPLECEKFKCTVRELDRKHCKVFDVEVRNTSTVVNDIRVREGHARLDCSFPEGGSLVTNLEFDGCS